MEDWKNIINQNTQAAHDKSQSKQQELQQLFKDLGVSEVVNYIVEQANIVDPEKETSIELRSKLLSFLTNKDAYHKFHAKQTSDTAIGVYFGENTCFSILLLEQSDQYLASLRIERLTKQLVFMRPAFRKGQIVYKSKDVSTIKSISDTAETIINFILTPPTSDEYVSLQK